MTDQAVINAWLSLGSNVDADLHLSQALVDLSEQFGDLIVSPIYQSQAVGFDGDPFINLVVGIKTNQSADTLVATFHEIEAKHGRTRDAAKFSSRTLDIDLLTYGDQIISVAGRSLPRDEIIRYAFVLKPLADVAKDQLHPTTGKTYGQLWDEFDDVEQRLWRVEKQYPGFNP